MKDQEERKLIRDGLVRISDRVGELLADKYNLGEDSMVLGSLHAEIWGLRQSLDLFAGEVKAEEPEGRSENEVAETKSVRRETTAQ